MNKPEQININKKKASKLSLTLMISLCLIPLAINSAVLAPLLETLGSDILYADSILISTIDYLMSFIEVIAFAVTFAIVIFSAFFGSKKITSTAIIIFVLSLFLQIPISILMNVPLYGTVGTLKSVLFSLIPKLAYLLFCVLHVVLVYVFAARERRNFFYPARALRKMGMKKKDYASPLPIKGFYNKTNPIQRAALAMGFIIVIPKLILHVLGHITIGFPDGLGGVISYVLSYFTDVVYGFIAYIIALVLFSFFYDRLREKETDEAAAPSETKDLLD